MNAAISKRAPYPNESVELIYTRVRSHWAYHAWTVVIAALTVFVIPVTTRGPDVFQRLGLWLHRVIDHHALSWFASLTSVLTVTVASVFIHEVTHLAAATLFGRARARFSIFRYNPAVFWYGAVSRNRAIVTLVLPCVLWGVLPLVVLSHLPPLAALVLYIPISQNLVGSRTDIAQAYYIARFVPVDARLYCHPDGLAFAPALPIGC